MPSKRSANKRLRSSARQRMVHRMRKSRVKTTEKRLDEVIASGDASAAEAALERCYSELDRAAKKGTLHRNKASRKKQRLAARVRAMN